MQSPQPTEGDMDLGQETGDPFPCPTSGTYVVPIRVNTDTRSLGTIDFWIYYDVCKLPGVPDATVADWTGAELQTDLREGELHIIAQAHSSQNDAAMVGENFHIMDLTFNLRYNFI